MNVKYIGKSIFGGFANMQSLTNGKLYEVIKDHSGRCNCYVINDDTGKPYAMDLSECEVVGEVVTFPQMI